MRAAREDVRDGGLRCVLQRSARYVSPSPRIRGRRVARDAAAARRSSASRRSERLVHGLAAEAEGAEVHGDHERGAEVDEGLQRLFGAGVDGAVAVGEVGPDGQQGDLRVRGAGRSRGSRRSRRCRRSGRWSGGGEAMT